MPEPYRNAALIRQTALEFDQLQPAQIVARLQPLAKPGDPWFGSGGRDDRTGAGQAGQEPGGRAALRRHRQGHGVPETIRARAVQIAGIARRRRERRDLSPRPSRTTMIRPKYFRVAILIAAALAASGCGMFKKGKGPSTPVLGQRIAVLTGEGDVKVDPGDRGATDDPAAAGREQRTGPSPAAIRPSRWDSSRSASTLAPRIQRPGRGAATQPDCAARRGADRRQRPGLHDRHAWRSARVRRPHRRRRCGQARRRPRRAGRVALRRRDRLRQRPDLRDQRPRLCRRDRRAQRRNRVAGTSRRPAARRAHGREQRGLRDQPGQPDLFAQGERRLDQLVAGRVARGRRRVRLGLAGGRAGNGRRGLLVG